MSLKPFKDYKVSSQVFIVYRNLARSVYPDINHKVVSSDVIAVVVCDQIIL